MARNDEDARRLATIPGIGPLNATALVRAIGDDARSAADATWPPGSACPPAGHHRRQAKAAGDHQARQHVPRKLLSRVPEQHAVAGQERPRRWGMAARPAGSRAPECGCGLALARIAWAVQRTAAASSGAACREMRSAARRHGASRQGLRVVDEDGLTVDRRPEAYGSNGARRRPLRRTRDARISILARAMP